MPPHLSTSLQLWQRRDLLHRLGESGIRGVCWGLLIAGAVPGGLVAPAAAVALLGECIWLLRQRRPLERVAEAVDTAGGTAGLLRTALSAEQGQAWGSPELLSLVRQQALDAAPRLAPHAVRRLRFPRAPLVAGLLGAILLLLPVMERTAERGASAVLADLTAEQAGDGQRTDLVAGLPPSSGLLDGSGTMGDGPAKASAERGEGEAGAAGAAGGGEAAGEARQGASEGGGDAEDGDRPTGRSSSAEGGASQGDTTPTGGGLGGQQADGDAATAEDPDAMALTESAMREGRQEASTDPFSAEQDSIQSVDQERMEKHYTDLDNAVGAGTLMPEQTSALTQDFEETPTNTLGLALAGQGGINDAPGSVDLAADPDADELQTAEAWVAARWRASAAGTLQTIDGGQSGGQSGAAWAELYQDYAALAEARMHREEIPPGRRDYVRTYFESIRSEP
jgi:hypothetical protein